MTRADLETLFRMECRQHKIDGVKFKWMGKGESALAKCNAEHGEIEFFEIACFLSYENAVELIRHELAHFLDYQEFNCWKKTKNNKFNLHGKSWKRFCAKLGCRARVRIPFSKYGF